MANFINTSIGLVNLDLIVVVDQDGEKCRMQTVSGISFNCDIIGNDDLEGGSIIPAAPSTFATVIYTDSPLGGRPSQTWHRAEPIIAWRDRGDMLHPIFLEELPSNGRALLEIAGSWQDLSFSGSRYDTFEGAVEGILGVAQSNWDLNERIRARKAAAKEERGTDARTSLL